MRHINIHNLRRLLYIEELIKFTKIATRN